MTSGYDEVLRFIVENTGATKAERGEHIQSLWGGYGELFRVHLTHDHLHSVVVKWAKPPARTEETDAVSHARKCRSYNVETAFYRAFPNEGDVPYRFPKRLASRAVGGKESDWLLVLEDLDAAGFSKRVRDPRDHELEACLAWLAAFHARFLGVPPTSLWRIGTYWHLGTRAEELAAIRDLTLRKMAPEFDRQLNGAHFKTFVHGDAKPANFCFTHDGKRVAAVDFQYVGGGAGIKDVAYLLYGSSAAVVRRSLDVYFEHLRNRLAKDIDHAAVEREWRGLYGVAADDFHRFLAGWRG